VASPPAGPTRRGYERSVGGLIGSLVACCAVIAFVWGLTWFQRTGTPDPTPTVSYRAALTAAQADAPFHILAPKPAPVGLRATSVSWKGAGRTVSWQVGFLTPQNEFVGLYQGNGPAAEFVHASTPATQPEGTVTIDGMSWRVLSEPSQGETAFVRTTPGVTVVVTGTASESDLRAFASSLH
jgi:hypothetical protein